MFEEHLISHIAHMLLSLYLFSSLIYYVHLSCPEPLNLTKRLEGVMNRHTCSMKDFIVLVDGHCDRESLLLQGVAVQPEICISKNKVIIKPSFLFFQYMNFKYRTYYRASVLATCIY